MRATCLVLETIDEFLQCDWRLGMIKEIGKEGTKDGKDEVLISHLALRYRPLQDRATDGQNEVGSSVEGIVALRDGF
jgi:hypothetical protein